MDHGGSDFRGLIAELKEENLDSIRFATYRAACKLRFVQKKINFHLVDIWNTIESFRENGLNSVADTNVEVKVSRVELLLSTIYHNLNKRLPLSKQVDTDASLRLLLGFLLAAFESGSQAGRLRVFSVKIALATLCAGKLLDKLRYVFSQISDENSIMDENRFKDYLRQVLALPSAVFEGPTFGFTENLAKSCFSQGTKVTLNVFLDTLMADPCPSCLMWLPLFHRMANVEHVFHPVVCNGCDRESFTGFRYKCQRCHHYQLCQDCFWRGRTTGAHTNQHEMKEYSSYKSPAHQLTHSISKSLRCLPSHTSSIRPMTLPEKNDRRLDLSNAIPSLPPRVQNRTAKLNDISPFYEDTLDNALNDINYPSLSSPTAFLLSGGGTVGKHDGEILDFDDEHKLIARYCAKLSGRSNYPPLLPEGTANCLQSQGAMPQRALISKLDQQNKELLREIGQLEESMMVPELPTGVEGTEIISELDGLRQKKQELEERMRNLQGTRRDLMGQLESLMHTLKSPKGGSPQTTVGADPTRRPFVSAKRPQTSDLQKDLLCAADSITHSMTHFLKELDESGAKEIERTA